MVGHLFRRSVLRMGMWATMIPLGTSIPVWAALPVLGVAASPSALTQPPEASALTQRLEQGLERLGMPEPFRVVDPVTLHLASSVSQDDPALMPLRSKDDDEVFGDDTEYRYDFEDRHLTLGITGSGGITRGVVINAFPYEGMVSPYFRFGFGDGNTLQLDLTAMVSQFYPNQYPWFFFRTPILGGDVVGSLYMVIPTISFRYEMDMSATISKKSPFMAVGGLGVGGAYAWGYVNLTGNGSSGAESSQTLINQIMIDAVPMIGVKYRLGEFAALEVGGKAHLLFPLLFNNTSGVGTAGWSFGRPYAVPEGWLDASRFFDGYLSFSYDFG